MTITQNYTCPECGWKGKEADTDMEYDFDHRGKKIKLICCPECEYEFDE